MLLQSYTLSVRQRGDPFALPNHQLVGLLQVLRRDRAVQRPGDAHGAAALVGDVAGAAQEGVGGGGAQDAVLLELADEQQHAAAARLVVDVPKPGGGVALVVLWLCQWNSSSLME